MQPENRSVEYKGSGWKRDPDGKHITFTEGCGIGRFRLVGSKSQRIAEFPLKLIKRVRIVRGVEGYSVQFAVQAERRLEHISTGKRVGIDLGVKEFLTPSEGEAVANPRHLRKAEKRLKRLHRRLSRTQKKSKDRARARKR